MAEDFVNVGQIYARGKEILTQKGPEWTYVGGGYGPSVAANRKYLGSLFFETKLFDPVEVDTSFSIFGLKLKTPIFCTAISRSRQMDDNSMGEIGEGIKKAGSFMMLGVGGSRELQVAIDSGAPVVKMIKPYRNTDLIWEKLHDAESRGCVAVGIDIDHGYGVQRISGEVRQTETYGPQPTEVIRQVISQSKLPFIIKGVLSLADAEKAYQLGASAIVVTNHGSTFLQYSLPSLVALPRIVEAYGNKMTILVDTGFETGDDVLKGLALGAKGVGFASLLILSWVANGAKGVETLVNLLTAELKRTMAATGCQNLTAINRSIVVSLPERL